MQRHFNTTLPYLLLFLLTIFLLHPSFKNPGLYQTHDSEFHVIRAMHFTNELVSGQFPVRIAPQLAYGYGYPVFNFFYPLPNYVTALFQIVGFTTVTSWKLMQILVTFTSLVIFYIWMKQHFDSKSSLVATTLFALAPFRIVMLYVTGQIGGYYGLLFASLIGLGLYKLFQNPSTTKNKTGSIIVSIGIAGLITSHLLSVIIFFIPLFAYFLYLLKTQYSLKKITQLTFSVLLGIGLSAFYFIPFMLEKSWITLGNTILIDYTDHFVSLKQLLYSPWGYGTSVAGTADTMSFQVGFALLLVLVVATVQILKKIFVQKKKELFSVGLICVLLILVFLMTPAAAPFWQVIIPIQLIQFPWRLLASVLLVGSVLTAWSVFQVAGKKQYLYIAVLILLNLLNIRNYLHPWPLNWKTDVQLMQQKEYFGSTDISWELMPVTATKTPHEPVEAVTNATQSGVVITNVSHPTKGTIKEVISFTATQSATLDLSVWDLPVWKLKVNNQEVTHQTSDTGTILVPIDADSHTVELQLVKTATQKWSDFLSLVSLGVLILYCIKRSEGK